MKENIFLLHGKKTSAFSILQLQEKSSLVTTLLAATYQHRLPRVIVNNRLLVTTFVSTLIVIANVRKKKNNVN